MRTLRKFSHNNRNLGYLKIKSGSGYRCHPLTFTVLIFEKVDSPRCFSGVNTQPDECFGRF